MTGPRSASSSRRPTRSARSGCASRSLKRSKIGRSTSTRLPAEQVCPVFCVIALHTVVAAARGRRRRTPPAATCRRARAPPGCGASAPLPAPAGPPRGEPVKETKSIPGWRLSAAPASSPRPVTMFSAPAGKPASTAAAPSSRHTRHASSAGFITVALPIASAGARVRAEHLRRVVPRRDVRGDAERLAHHRDVVAVEVGNHLAVDLVGGAAVELEVARHRTHVGARLRDRLAGVVRLDPGQPLRFGQHALGKRCHQPAALGRRSAGPSRRQRRASGRHCGVDLGGAAARKPGEGTPGGRRGDRHRLDVARRPSGCRSGGHTAAAIHSACWPKDRARGDRFASQIPCWKVHRPRRCCLLFCMRFLRCTCTASMGIWASRACAYSNHGERCPRAQPRRRQRAAARIRRADQASWLRSRLR